jgi:hypothetical protein
VFGPLVFSCDPGNVHALDGEAACCFDFAGSRLVLGVGLVGASEFGAAGKRHGLVLREETVAVLRASIAGRVSIALAPSGPLYRLPCQWLPLEAEEERDPDEEERELPPDDPQGQVLALLDVMSLLRPEGVEFALIGDNPDDAAVLGALVGEEEGSALRRAYVLRDEFITALWRVLLAGPGAWTVLREESPYHELFRDNGGWAT